MIVKNHAFMPRYVRKVSTYGYPFGGYTDRVRYKFPKFVENDIPCCEITDVSEESTAECERLYKEDQRHFKFPINITHDYFKHINFGGKVQRMDGLDITVYTTNHIDIEHDLDWSDVKDCTDLLNEDTGSPYLTPLEIVNYNPETGNVVGNLRINRLFHKHYLFIDFYVGSGNVVVSDTSAVWAGEIFKSDCKFSDDVFFGGPNGIGVGEIYGDVFEVEGPYGRPGIQFDSNSYVTCRPVDFAAVGAINFWYSSTSVSGFLPIMRIWDEFEDCGFEILVSGDVLRVGVKNHGGSYQPDDITMSPFINDGSWHNIIISKQDGVFLLSVDGFQNSHFAVPNNLNKNPIRPLIIGGFEGKLAFIRLSPNYYKTYFNLFGEEVLGYYKNGIFQNCMTYEVRAMVQQSVFFQFVETQFVPIIEYQMVYDSAVNLTFKGSPRSDLVFLNHNAVFRLPDDPKFGSTPPQYVCDDYLKWWFDGYWQSSPGLESTSDFHTMDPGSVYADNVEIYQDFSKAIVPQYIEGNCCARVWQFVGDNEIHFLENSHDNAGPLGFSDPIYHPRSLDITLHWTYCGKCDDVGILANVPTFKE
jgi:hypothetical protein